MKRIVYFLATVILFAACTPEPKNAKRVASLPDIFPDYVDVTVPSTIAPLDFNLLGDDVEAIEVRVEGEKGEAVVTRGKGDLARFDIDDWHALLSNNIGQTLRVTVTALRRGEWIEYKPFAIHVSPLPLDDYGLTYRRIAPGYEVYSKMGIYQRCLSNFDEEPIIENSVAAGACLNCHSANAANPDEFTFHVRGLNGATMIRHDGKDEWLAARPDSLDGSMVYPYWHPSGRLCAYSTNSTHQAFHSVATERIEVYDDASDVFVYNTATHEILADSLLFTKDHLETYPAFSPDGKTLYFVSSQWHPIPDEYKEIRYDLCAIAFDAESLTYGTRVDTLFCASRMGKSLVFPRPSYDGRFIMFTMADYGCFPIWHKEADLWLLDLATNEARPLDEVNSPDTEAFHNWSSNSHWFVFSSRRMNGLYTQLFLASVDQHGRATKPFLLPQRNPKEYYDATTFSFNVPDFTRRRVDFDQCKAGAAIRSPQRQQVTVKR